MSAESQIKTTVDELLKVLDTKNIVGEPIEIEDKTFIPFTRIGVGFGAGVGEGKGGSNEAAKGSGGGGGIGIDPVAILVIYKGVKGSAGVSMLQLSLPGPVAKSVSDILPTVIEKIGDMRKDKDKAKEKK